MNPIYCLAIALASAPLTLGQQALQLDNVLPSPSGFVRVADDPQLEPAHVTLEAWITPQGNGVGFANDQFGAMIAGKALEGDTGSFLVPYGLLWSSGTGGVVAAVRTGGASQGLFVHSDRTVPIGTTAHVAMTFDGTHVELYVDGILSGCGVTPGPTLDYGPEPFLIGAGNFLFNFHRRFNGRIDEVRVWDHARSQTEILASASSPVSGTESGLVACWNFDSGNLSDITGNGHTGIAIGTELSFVSELVPTTPGSSVSGTIYCSPAVNNSTGAPGEITAIGSSDVTDNEFFLVASSLPAGEFGYFLASQSQGTISPPNSSGTLCVVGNIGRFNQQGLLGQGPCFARPIDLGLIPVNPPQPVLAGETWNFQCWYRDGATNNFTNAVSVTFN